jgi:hypothetical protein
MRSTFRERKSRESSQYRDLAGYQPGHLLSHPPPLYSGKQVALFLFLSALVLGSLLQISPAIIRRQPWSLWELNGSEEVFRGMESSQEGQSVVHRMRPSEGPKPNPLSFDWMLRASFLHVLLHYFFSFLRSLRTPPWATSGPQGTFDTASC